MVLGVAGGDAVATGADAEVELVLVLVLEDGLGGLPVLAGCCAAAWGLSVDVAGD